MSVLLNKLTARVGGSARTSPLQRFVIIGLPRSGTTYVMTLLNSHRDVVCYGERFNPYGVIDQSDQDDSHDAVLARDKDPLGHMQALFAKAEKSTVSAAGFKFMLGHNLAVLRALQADPKIKILYIWRENKLAQVSSWLAALQSKEWARTRHDTTDPPKRLRATPRKIAQHWHEFATTEALFEGWLDSVDRPVMRLEYRQLFAPDLPARLCGFLSVSDLAPMDSPLVKQGQNTIMERFHQPEPIKYYFRQIGRGNWLNDEL